MSLLPWPPGLCSSPGFFPKPRDSLRSWAHGIIPLKKFSSCITCNLYIPAFLELLGRIHRWILDMGIHHNTARLKKYTHLGPQRLLGVEAAGRSSFLLSQGSRGLLAVSQRLGRRRSLPPQLRNSGIQPSSQTPKIRADSTRASPKFGH